MASATWESRRQRLSGQHIAKAVGISAATVSRILKGAGLSRLQELDSPAPVRRYERQDDIASPGDRASPLTLCA